MPFGWKISPFIYHTTGLLGTSFFRSIGIPCILYIGDRHNGHLQVCLDKGEYRSLATADERNRAVAKSAIFLVAYYLVKLGYFLGLSKSTVTPVKIVAYLGFMRDSSEETFHLIPEKKGKFVALIQKLLELSYVSVTAPCRKMRFFREGSAGNKALYKRDERSHFNGSTFSEADLVAWSFAVRNLTLVVL